MKKIGLIITTLLMFQLLSAQINMSSNGYVTIGSTADATFPLDVRGYTKFQTGSYNNVTVGMTITQYQGDVALDPLSSNTGSLGYYKRWSSIYVNNISYTTLTKFSDERCKKNITPINNSLQKILKLNGVKFDYKQEFFKNEKTNKLTNQIGLLAQEVQKVFPELISYDSVQNLYGIMYDDLIPVIIEAMKEQQTQIESLKKAISKNKISSKKQIINSESDLNDLSETNYNELTKLSQNSPNPFTQSTEIEYYLSESANRALLCIYDLNGLQIKSYQLTNKGNGSITISGAELRPGMYLYTLIVDGKAIDTKRMILTE